MKFLKNSIFSILFAFFFSLVILLDSKLIYTGKLNVFTKIDFSPFFIKDFFFLLILTCTNTFLLILIEKGYIGLTSKCFKKKRWKKPIFILPFFLFAWLPYLLTYYPGGVFADTFVSIEQLENIKEVGFLHLNNNHPILYTLILNLCIGVGKWLTNNSLTGGILFFQWVQVFFCALCLTYFVYVLSKKEIPKNILYLIIAFFCFFPLIPFYVLSLWKDTPFNFSLLLLTTCLFDALTTPNYFNKKGPIFLYGFLCILVSFLRNNGIFIVLGLNLVLFLFIYKKESKTFKNLVLGVLLGIILIQGPIYSYFHLSGSSFIESMAIPFSQIAYSVTHDAKLKEPQEKYLNEVVGVERLKEIYTPLLFDTIKWDKDFNSSFFAKEKLQFFTTWISLMPKNSKNYTKAYLLGTLGFWNPLKSSEEAYVSLYTWPGYKEIEQKDVLNDHFHFSLRNILKPHVYISSAFFLWIMFLSMYLTFIQKKYKYLVIYLPAFLSWFTFMLATPIAFSMRYVYIFVLMLPFDLFLPILPYPLKENKSRKNKGYKV